MRPTRASAHAAAAAAAALATAASSQLRGGGRTLICHTRRLSLLSPRQLSACIKSQSVISQQDRSGGGWDVIARAHTLARREWHSVPPKISVWGHAGAGSDHMSKLHTCNSTSTHPYLEPICLSVSDARTEIFLFQSRGTAHLHTGISALSTRNGDSFTVPPSAHPSTPLLRLRRTVQPQVYRTFTSRSTSPNPHAHTAPYQAARAHGSSLSERASDQPYLTTLFTGLHGHPPRILASASRLSARYLRFFSANAH